MAQARIKAVQLVPAEGTSDFPSPSRSRNPTFAPASSAALTRSRSPALAAYSRILFGSRASRPFVLSFTRDALFFSFFSARFLGLAGFGGERLSSPSEAVRQRELAHLVH